MTNNEIITRGEQVMMSTYKRQPLALVRGKGVWVWDADGRRYLDLLGGIAVNSLGHDHPRLVAAITRQAQTLIHCSNLYWIQPQVELAQLLTVLAGLDRVFFSNSGAEANEGAIKLARKYAKMQGHNERSTIIATHRSFHGRTLATLAATGQEQLQKGFEPLPAGFTHVGFNDLDALASAITPATCGVMLEPVQGEGGIHCATPAYLRGVRELCSHHDLVLILDEIQCGLGRTGQMFAYQGYDIQPDIVTLAKGLGGGVPIGAMLASAQVAAAFKPGDHGSTFGGNPLACAAALAVLNTIQDDNLVERAGLLGEHVRQRLEPLSQQLQAVVEVRGLGLMMGIQLAVPGDQVVEACREQGVLINCTGGSVIRMLPPLIIERDELDQGLDVLIEVLRRI